MTYINRLFIYINLSGDSVEARANFIYALNFYVVMAAHKK